jgi:hypothetical protein
MKKPYNLYERYLKASHIPRFNTHCLDRLLKRFKSLSGYDQSLNFQSFLCRSHKFALRGSLKAPPGALREENRGRKTGKGFKFLTGLIILAGMGKIPGKMVKNGPKGARLAKVADFREEKLHGLG